jgi:hypothetical protein
MEALVFGLIALNTLQRKQERIVPEPAEFRSFDLRTLERLYNARDNSPGRPSDRKRMWPRTYPDYKTMSHADNPDSPQTPPGKELPSKGNMDLSNFAGDRYKTEIVSSLGILESGSK